jgi:hypothetical protein
MVVQAFGPENHVSRLSYCADQASQFALQRYDLAKGEIQQNDKY